ncbi:MAG TPA: cytochrome P450 [Mycobacterium sp.]|nr:cytochrome P450 [Mycobacterium sp.]HTX96951.1 cytochrome P450 [Mycobacterium sp.]
MEVTEQPFRTTRRAFGPSMLDREGAHHLRLRGLAASALSPKHIDIYEESIIKPVAGELLDRLMHGNPTDLVRYYARELPIAVFCRVMGIPPAHGPWLYSALRGLIAHIDQDGGSVAEVTAQRKVLRRYFEDRLRERDYCDGLLRRFAEADDGFTTIPDVLNNATMLLAAGTETTGLAVGTLLAHLAMFPTLLDEMRADPGLVPAVVSESLRHEPPLHFTTRFLAEDVDVDDTTLKAGSAVQLCLGSANRDERRYASPDRFDPHRADLVPLTFGYGMHRCIGSGLANRELAVMIRMFIERGLTLELAGDDVPRVEGRVFRGVRRLLAAVKPR